MTKMAAAIPRSLSIGCTTLLDFFARLLWPVRVNRDSPLLRLSTLFPPSELTAAPATEIKKKPDVTRAALGAAVLEASALADLPFSGRYIASVCGRSTYKLTWEEIVTLPLPAIRAFQLVSGSSGAQRR